MSLRLCVLGTLCWVFGMLVGCEKSAKLPPVESKAYVLGDYSLDKDAMVSELEQKIVKLAPAQQSKGQLAIAMIRLMTLKMTLGTDGDAKIVISHQLGRSGGTNVQTKKGEWKWDGKVLRISSYDAQRKTTEESTCRFEGEQLICMDGTRKQKLVFRRS